jgi:putative restriction endonuclease
VSSSWICWPGCGVHRSAARLRAPHKPLLLLWLFGRFAATGSTAAAYAEAEESVSTLINDFGPPVASASAGRQRAAMPFVHLEREIWDLRDGSGGGDRAGRFTRLRRPHCPRLLGRRWNA